MTEEKEETVEVVEPPKQEEHHHSKDHKPEWAKSLEDKFDALAEEVRKIAPTPSGESGSEESSEMPKPGHVVETDESPANKKPWTHRAVFK